MSYFLDLYFVWSFSNPRDLLKRTIRNAPDLRGYECRGSNPVPDRADGCNLQSGLRPQPALILLVCLLFHSRSLHHPSRSLMSIAELVTCCSPLTPREPWADAIGANCCAPSSRHPAESHEVDGYDQAEVWAAAAAGARARSRRTTCRAFQRPKESRLPSLSCQMWSRISSFEHSRVRPCERRRVHSTSHPAQRLAPPIGRHPGAIARPALHPPVSPTASARSPRRCQRWRRRLPRSRGLPLLLRHRPSPF